MVFSSIPVYLDPANWPQQQSHQGGSSEIPNNIPLIASQPPPPHGGGGGGGAVGSIRPGSMADRARLAKIPQPEPGLKCPRCESTNTKFCYFNNYSLTQPRHFCKTCRRYWTRGGALRNVPVGGGCRRNKRSKRSRSKSPIMASDRHATASTSNSGGVSSTTPAASDIISHLPPPASQLPFLPPLHNLNDYISRDIGLNFSRTGTQLATMMARGSHGNNSTSDIEFQIGGTTTTTTGINGQMLPNGSFLHQFPFFANVAPSQPLPPPPAQAPGLYPMEGEGTEQPPSGGMNGVVHQLLSKQLDSRDTQMGSNAVKMEETRGLNNLSRNLSFSAALSSGHDQQTQFWSNHAWTDLSGFSSSTSNNIL